MTTETAVAIVLRFYVYNAGTKKLEILDTDTEYSVEGAKNTARRCVEAMLSGKSADKPSEENLSITHYLFGLAKGSFLYTFMGVILKQETLLIRDLATLGLNFKETPKPAKKRKKKNG